MIATVEKETLIEELWAEVEKTEGWIAIRKRDLADNELLLATNNCKSVSWRESLVAAIESLKAEIAQLQTKKNALAEMLDEFELNNTTDEMEQAEMFPTTQDYTAATLRLEGIPVIYYQFTGQPVTVQAGDFIRSTLLPMVCGFVTEHVELHLGSKATMRGYRVRLASGRIDFIPDEDAELVG